MIMHHAYNYNAYLPYVPSVIINNVDMSCTPSLSNVISLRKGVKIEYLEIYLVSVVANENFKT